MAPEGAGEVDGLGSNDGGVRRTGASTPTPAGSCGLGPGATPVPAPVSAPDPIAAATFVKDDDGESSGEKGDLDLVIEACLAWLTRARFLWCVWLE